MMNLKSIRFFDARILGFNNLTVGYKTHLMTSEVGPYHRYSFPLWIALGVAIEKKDITIKLGIG